MAAVSDQPTIDLREPGGWRRSKNQIATGLMYFAFVVILVPLGLVIYEVIAKGAKAISWQFLTNSTIPPNVMPLGQGGMGAAVVGTLEITAFAAPSSPCRLASSARSTSTSTAAGAGWRS